MKVLLSWLREFAALTGDSATLAEEMTNLGMELESVHEIGGNLDGIVLAQVLDIRPHPDADRIRLVDVDLGDGQPLQICCGASNMTVGDRVPLATLGTVMPGGMEIARRKMRGQVSNGMLCSAKELELGEDHSGILIVEDATGSPLGTPIAEVLDISPDVVFDFDALPNRPDTLSMLGVARDLAAHQGVALQIREPEFDTAGPDAASLVSVDIEAPDLCGRFSTLVIKGVSVGPSPRWLAQRLLAAGMRPVNNVVDASNYVMLELGQPTHAYDLAKLVGGRLGIRWARAGERVVTLDDTERVVSAADGVIVDGDDTPIAIAGVMGGASTEISETTSDVVVEAAWWQPLVIAGSAERLNLHSEASLRFKRGVDPDMGRRAARRVAELIVELAGGTVCPGMVEATGNLPVPATVRVDPARINGLLGTALEPADMATLLDRIGFVTRPVGEQFDVTVPSWRPDSAIEADIAEEVARHYGMARIPKTVPVSPHAGRLSPRQRDRRTLRATLTGAGLSEAMPMPFLAPGDLESFGLSGEGYTLANPLVAEESVLRTTLLPGLVKAVAFNESHREFGVRLFEIGRCFVRSGAPLVDVAASAREDTVLPGESERLAVVLAGAEAPEAVQLLETLLRAVHRWPARDGGGSAPQRARIPALELRAAALPGLHPGRGALVELGEQHLGEVGEIDPRVLAGHGVSQRVAWLELDLGVLLDLPAEPATEVVVSHYPGSDIDLAFVVAEEVAAAEVRRTILGTATRCAANGVVPVRVELFDVFRAESLGAGRKSLAFHLTFQAPDRTLTDAEVAEVRSAIITSVESTHAAQLRG